ncbi:MAG TPA: disulfide bond formation protein B [Methylibium sp.]|uniref:disulfide bond formation protein B n=1 Tax=Methylibium sp. TaxID=2067992 RepID=UPI002DB7E283|nr:disulfide bond formation protein B [Methylibium sp.]HEU4459409.1 disulfide bond formation protein B [Methylibium sp.]
MSARLLGVIAATSVAAVAAALVAQHGFGMQPCPWCVFQRVIYLGIAVVAALGALLPGRGSRLAAALAVVALCAGGIASAVFQHQVAARDASCAFTLADRFLGATGLETRVPWLFQVTATCVDAAASRLLGLPFEVWSGLLFVLLGVAGLLALGRPVGKKRAGAK